MSGEVRRLALGVIGHVDHGKTALVRVLTGMETDRLPEEQRRGVSIALGFAHARFGEAEIDFIDMPGHERFVRTMVSGATGVAAALLVVAANEGVKPQTLEHLEIGALLGLPRILPVISKADLASEEQIALAIEATLAEVCACGLEAAAPTVVSAVTGLGLDALVAVLARLAADAPVAADDGFPWLPIDRAFTVSGRGTVVTGTLRRGRLSAEDALTLHPGGEAVRVRGLQVHGAAASGAEPGGRVAVNLRGLDPSQAPRGLALAPPGMLAASTWLSVEVRATRGAALLKTGARLNLLIGAAEVLVRLRLLDRDALEPGQSALAQLETAEPVAVPARERFVLRLPSPASTVGGGRVLDPLARRLRRNDDAVLHCLRALSARAPEEIVRLGLAEAGAAAISPARLAGLAGLSPSRVDRVLDAAGARRLADGQVIEAEALKALARALADALRANAETQPNGMARRRLVTLSPQAAPAAVDAAIAMLAAEGRVSVEGGAVRLAPLRADAAAKALREAALANAVGRRLQAGGLTPPDMDEIAPTPVARQALERLVKRGDAVRTFDRVQKREVVFHRDALDEARARLAPLLAPPGLTVGEAGAALGVSRKFSVPLLEYLDVLRFTRRLGDRRVLGPAGED